MPKKGKGKNGSGQKSYPSPLGPPLVIGSREGREVYEAQVKQKKATETQRKLTQRAIYPTDVKI